MADYANFSREIRVPRVRVHPKLRAGNTEVKNEVGANPEQVAKAHKFKPILTA